MIELRGAGWASPPLRLARTWRDRLIGLRPRPGPFGLVLRTGSVHGFGLRTPVAYIAVSDDGVVVRCGRLMPRRLVTCRRAMFIIELPGSLALPELGSVLTAHRLGSWPEL